MAWIKMRHVLASHPKVVTLALRLCNADETVDRSKVRVLGALYLAWCLVDQLAHDDGRLAMRAEALDTITATPGFTAAMVEVGWLVDHGDALQFLEYQEHNGPTAKSRALTQKRVAASRARNAAVTPRKRSCNATVTGERNQTRQEERREEEKKDPPSSPPPGGDAVIPDVLRTEAFAAAWATWLTERRDRRKPVTARAASVQLAKLAAVGPERAVEAIEASIANGWQGLFPERTGVAPRGSQRTQRDNVGAMQEWLRSRAGGEHDAQ